MAKFSMPVLGVALFFDVLAFGLACGALAKRSKVSSDGCSVSLFLCLFYLDA